MNIEEIKNAARTDIKNFLNESILNSMTVSEYEIFCKILNQYPESIHIMHKLMIASFELSDKLKEKYEK